MIREKNEKPLISNPYKISIPKAIELRRKVVRTQAFPMTLTHKLSTILQKSSQSRKNWDKEIGVIQDEKFLQLVTHKILIK